jgi:ABC-type nitrate/sulfonate/bicarbonate transport system permease component
MGVGSWELGVGEPTGTNASPNPNSQLLTPRAKRARWFVQNERLVYGLAGFVTVLVVWELAVRVGWLKAAFISSPTRIVAAAQTEIAQGRIWGDIGVSLLEFSLGFLAATIVGVLIGLIGGWSKRANYILDPWLAALYATPDVALVPLIILVLGIGIPSKVFVVFLTSLFSVAINTLVGVQSTDPRMLEVARSFRANQLTVFRTVVLPSTLPYVLTGLRLASGRALVGVVLAELIAANQGIGFMINVAGSVLNTGRLMVGVLLLGIFGVLLGEVMRRVEQRFEVWRPSRSL